MAGAAIVCAMTRTAIACLLVMSMAAPALRAWQPQAATASFSAEDMLKVVTASVLAMSDDGRLIAVSERRSYDNSESDHYRYGDPTYIAPSAVRLVVINTATGARTYPLGDRLAHVRQAAFSRDGARLGLITVSSSGVLTLLVGPSTGTAAPVPLKDPRLIATNSQLEWSVDGTAVILSLRTTQRDQQAAERFRTLTKGPIIVQSSSDPFLDWDALSREAKWRSVAEVQVASGVVTERVPERKLSNVQSTRDQRTLIFQEDVTEKTDYDVIGGTDNTWQSWSQGEPAPKVLIPAKDGKGLTLRWNDDGRMFAYSKQGEVFVRSISDTEARNLTPKPKPEAPSPATPPPADKKDVEAPESFSAGSFSRDGSKILVTSSKGWYIVNIADGVRTKIVTLDKDEAKNPRLSVIDWAADGSAIYASWGARETWDRGLVKISTSTGEMTTLVKDSRLYSAVRQSRDGSTFVLSIADGDRPGDLYVADPGFTKVTRLTTLNPWLDGRPLPKSELVKYRDADGRELFGVLRYPTNYVAGTRVPVVFELYETFFDNGFNARAAFLGANGYAFFTPSVHLVTGRPGESWLKGVTAAANKLIDMGVADPDRLGVEGTSYGGYATVLLITQTDRFKAAVNISGKVNMVSFYTDSERFGVRNTHAPEKSQDRIGGTLWEYPERYLDHSAILNADRITTPLLTISGDQDPNVPGNQSREIFYALRRLGKTVDWVHYANGAHRPPNSVAEAIDFETRILRWFDKYLKASAK